MIICLFFFFFTRIDSVITVYSEKSYGIDLTYNRNIVCDRLL